MGSLFSTDRFANSDNSVIIDKYLESVNILHHFLVACGDRNRRRLRFTHFKIINNCDDIKLEHPLFTKILFTCTKIFIFIIFLT
jgi:hypothetical protein